MGKRKEQPRRSSPIEKIFREIVGREMTPQERRVLLANPKKPKTKMLR